MAKGKRKGKKKQKDRSPQRRRTQENKRKKYLELLDKFPNAKERGIWEKKLGSEL